jgi:site-specific recombinase XerC
MLLKEAIDRYLLYIRHEQGLSKTTYKGYEAYLLAYYRFIVETACETPVIDEFNGASVRDYFYRVTERSLRPRTLRTVMIPLRSLGSYLVKQRLLENNLHLPSTCHPKAKHGAAKHRKSNA